jgi:hypothetical protein
VIERAFWDEIARGDLPTECAVAVGVSPVAGSRWFRDAGGMSPYSWSPPAGRFLSFAERVEIALLRARGSGVRQIAAALGRSPRVVAEFAIPDREALRAAAYACSGWSSSSLRAGVSAARREPHPVYLPQPSAVPGVRELSDG